MNKKYSIRLNMILLISIILLVGCTAKQNKSLQHNHSEVDYYTCPMHPTVVQEEPGECPICGMDLVPEESKKTDVPESSSGQYYTCGMHPEIVQNEPGNCPICHMELVVRKANTGEDQISDKTKTITIDPTVIQNMGVRVKHVQYRDISHNIRTIGKVELADDESFKINLRFSGWIEKIFVNKIGQKIEKGDKLFEIYSPELISAQEEFLLAVNNYGKEHDFTKASERRLLLWSIPQTHLEKIVMESNAQQNVLFESPFNGFVLHKSIQEGSKVKAGTDIYHIGNLDKIWILADIYEFDTPLIKIGQNTEIELTNQPDKLWKGKISYIYPTLNPKTRTQKIRIELKNTELNLKPGMFANVEIEVEEMKNVLTIPTEAIIHSGERQIVFVSKGNGKFEPREIQIGLSDDSEYYTEIILGLEENEVVVVSGQFLLDSESQLQEAVQKLLGARLQKNIGSDKLENHEHSSEQTTYYTCPMHPNIVEDNPGDCPICGMDLIEEDI